MLLEKENHYTRQRRGHDWIGARPFRDMSRRRKDSPLLWRSDAV
jgi:hypothetical protein